MNSSPVRLNKVFLFLAIILFMLFSTALFFGGHQIYQRDTKLRHGNIDIRLHSSTEKIKAFFSDTKHALSFLKNLPDIERYINSGFKSINYRNEVEQVFYRFAKAYAQYYQIRVIDSSGYEVVRIDNKQNHVTIIVPDADLQDKKDRYYFQEAIKLDKNQLYNSAIDLNVEQGKIKAPHAPVIMLAIPLFNAKNEKRGILILNVYVMKMLKLLSEGVFIRTEEGNLVSLNSDGTVNFKKSSYSFGIQSGEIFISKDETIHYAPVEFLPGNKLFVAIYDRHPLSKAVLYKLVLISVILFVLFFSLILVIGYINYLEVREVVRSQKAIISSLAGLAEWRDPETGQHLERTRKYAVILANELRKNQKYRKIVTRVSVRDIFNGAHLHDIGKVGIRDAILLKKTSLTDEEYETMKNHVLIGKQILQDIIDRFELKQSFFVVARNICAYHHEKHNGQGYPEGLSGERIPVEARIFALCDAYDAIRSERPYKESLSHKEAVKRIKADKAEHFDPDIVASFLMCKQEFLKENNRDADL